MPMSEQKRTIDSQADYNKRKAAQKSGKSRVYSAMFMSENYFLPCFCVSVSLRKNDKTGSGKAVAR